MHHFALVVLGRACSYRSTTAWFSTASRSRCLSARSVAARRVRSAAKSSGATLLKTNVGLPTFTVLDGLLVRECSLAGTCVLITRGRRFESYPR